MLRPFHQLHIGGCAVCALSVPSRLIGVVCPGFSACPGAFLRNWRTRCSGEARCFKSGEHKGETMFAGLDIQLVGSNVLTYAVGLRMECIVGTALGPLIDT